MLPLCKNYKIGEPIQINYGYGQYSSNKVTLGFCNELMLSSGSPHVATAVFPHSLGCRLETIGHNTVTLWKCVGAVIGCGKISITNCGWKQNAILLAYITSGSVSGTFVFTACADMLYICSELSFPGACPQPQTLQGKRIFH